MTHDDSQLPQEEGIRINKYLASCGYESRRKADQLIAEGAVEINGKRVDAPGARVKPGDFVKVNGKRALPKDEVTLLLNKPKGFVCSRDPQGAEGTVYDLLPPKYRYVNYVGRLDADSEGLLILTNKGALNQRLGHPNNGVEKEYWVTLNQPFENSVLLQLLKGVRIPEGQAKAKYISRLSPRRASVVLEQGLKRQIRQMFACLGLRVKKLVRVRIGSLWGGDLLPGRTVILTDEQEALASVNPPQRKGLISAAQAFPSSGAMSAEQLAKELDEKAARAALEEEAHYKFNPADFETEEEAEAAYEPDDLYEQEYRPAPARRWNTRGARVERRAFRRSDDDSAPRRSFGEKRSFSTRRFDDRPRYGRERMNEAPRRFRGDDDRSARRFRSDDDRPTRRFHGDDDRPARRFRSDDDRSARRFRSDSRGSSGRDFGRSARQEHSQSRFSRGRSSSFGGHRSAGRRPSAGGRKRY